MTINYKRKRLYRTKLKVLRSAKGFEGYDDGNGNWVESNKNTNQFNIYCSLQPVTDNDLNKLPDSYKRTNVLKLYTNTFLKVIDEDAGTEADFVCIDGFNFQVQIVENWREGNNAHYKVLAVKEEKK